MCCSTCHRYCNCVWFELIITFLPEPPILDCISITCTYAVMILLLFSVDSVATLQISIIFMAKSEILTCLKIIIIIVL